MLWILPLISGCLRGGEPGATLDLSPFEEPPVPTELACPEPELLPFVPEALGWNEPANEADAERFPRIKHAPADLLGLPDGGLLAITDMPGEAAVTAMDPEVRGVMAHTEADTGLVSEPIPGEWVSLWRYSADTDSWRSLDRAQTDAEGGYAFVLAEEERTVSGVDKTFAVLEANGTCGTHTTFRLPAGTQAVISDIDGTLTESDEELFQEIGDMDYDAVAWEGAPLLMQTWADKGYQPIYLTARPHRFRSETRAWLRRRGFPDGPLITANQLVFGESAREYKRTWVGRITDDLGWDLVAAYGNATSDIDAYEDAGIPKGVTFIIGENAGVADTTGVDGSESGWNDHVQDYVEAQPDAASTRSGFPDRP